MAISQKSTKILWANAAGRCAFPGCQARLCTQDAGGQAPYIIGEMAHVCGEKPGASRYNADQAAAERDDYQNLILLCPTHHTLIRQARKREEIHSRSAEKNEIGSREKRRRADGG